MITERELNAVKLSPTKKDFYQIWNELLDTAGKLSDRWDPSSTNEADPGVVLLKVLTAIADKLNYNVDKNILEAFMPSATQEEAMRKLCDMLGYSMKYYRSATTPITITYTGSKDLSVSNIIIPKYTVVTNTDEDITYCILNQVNFADAITTKSVEAIEGTVELCTAGDSDIITLANLDDNNRFYFPETQIAENGVFVNSIKYITSNGVLETSEEDTPWTIVTNLNTQNINEKIFKFSYDSQEQLPYIQFPDDIANLINDGIRIRYTRTNGINGNIAVRTLNKFQTIEDIQCEDEEINLEEELNVTNTARTSNGYNKENINDAYMNYKKTIGTFDTLVTCRDYMNKIYQLTYKDLNPRTSTNTTPLISNVIVSDIRDDINKSYTLCSFDEYGINYIDKPKVSEGTDLINCFDLMIYPFSTISGTNSINEYLKSFTYNDGNLNNILSLLENNKTISHTFRTPENTDIVCIKNYLRLNAKISTTSKVSIGEQTSILNNIYTKIYENFNMRKLDFGEEIPYDNILEVISSADPKIKNVSLDEPIIYTRICTKEGGEYDYTSTVPSAETTAAKRYYNQLALRNILVGKIEVFNYDESFKPDYTETNGTMYPTPGSNKNIAKLESSYIPVDDTTFPSEGITLNENEVIQFRAPNFKTDVTYPAYVKYHIRLNPTTKIIPKDTDYQLGNNEFLVICYTPATQDDSTVAVERTVVYDKDKIIKANFDLQDSNVVHTGTGGIGKSWSSTGPFTIIANGQQVTIDGYFGLGVKEQIEIRRQAITTLNNGMINVYWQRNDDQANANEDGLVTFSFNEPGGSYTLKEGEYFYYTDKNKIDFLYYGNGTKITTDGIELTKNIKADNVSNEDILEYGLAAAIPWINKKTTSTSYLELKEYQYINLTNSDKLKALGTLASSSAPLLSNTWKALNNNESFTYIFSSDEEDIEHSVTSTAICPWEVRSKLEFDFSPTKAQTLTNKDTIKITYDDLQQTTATITNKSVKGNYSVITSLDNLGTSTLSNFIVKSFDIVNLDNGVNIDNYGDNITRITLSAGDHATTPFVTLNANIPTNDFGLIMMYYIPYQSTVSNYAYLKLTNSVTPKIYNNNNSWWTEAGYIDDDKYYLRPGINIVQLDAQCSIKIYPDANNKDIIIFSDLDLVPNDHTKSLNPKIDYKLVDYDNTLDQFNHDILAYDTNHEFYYNVLPDDSNLIDLNPYNSDETLSNPYVWYNYNNVNNKFVISEIDASYLINGISIEYSSKLR